MRQDRASDDEQQHVALFSRQIILLSTVNGYGTPEKLSRESTIPIVILFGMQLRRRPG